MYSWPSHPTQKIEPLKYFLYSHLVLNQRTPWLLPTVTKSKHMFTVITLSLLFSFILFHINTFSHLIPLLCVKDALSVFTTTILKNSSINDTICSFSDLRQIMHAFMITSHLKEIAVNWSKANKETSLCASLSSCRCVAHRGLLHH